MRDSLGTHAPHLHWTVQPHPRHRALDLLLSLLCAAAFWMVVGYLAYWVWA